MGRDRESLPLFDGIPIPCNMGDRDCPGRLSARPCPRDKPGDKYDAVPNWYRGAGFLVWLCTDDKPLTYGDDPGYIPIFRSMYQPDGFLSKVDMDREASLRGGEILKNALQKKSNRRNR